MNNNIKKIQLEFTLNEARIIKAAIASLIPPKEDEMILIMLYRRIENKLIETVGSHEP